MPGFIALLLLFAQPSPPMVDDLDNLVQIALEQNPEIQAARRRWEAASARPSQARALPNPTVSFAYWNAGSPFPGTSLGENPMSFVEPMVTQRIPFPGKLGLRGEIAQAESDREGRIYVAVRLRVLGDLKRAYFDLYHVERAIEIVEQNRVLLNRFVSVATRRYEVGSGLQQDILRAQVEETLLEDRLAVLTERAGSFAARINQLLHLPPDRVVRTSPDVSLSVLDYSSEQLYAIAEEANPMLDARRLNIDRDASALELAEKDHLPDFDVKVGRMFMGSFDDMWEVSISAEVPLFFWQKERRGVEQAASTLQKSLNEFEASGQALFRRVTDLCLLLERTDRLESLYRDAVIPQASLALESSLTAYRVGDLDFLGVLDNWSRLLDFEVEYYVQLAEHEKALAGLEELTGLELIQSGGSE